MSEEEIRVARGITPMHIILTAINSGVIGILAILGVVYTPVLPGVAALYPATAFEVAFGIWFGIWGAIASYIGCLIMNLYTGIPIVLAIPLSISDFLAAGIPAAAFRLAKSDPELKTIKDWINYIISGVILSSVPGSMYYMYILMIIGWVPSWEAYWAAVAAWNIGNYIVVLIIATPMLKILTSYVKRSGLYVEGWVV
ncbi:MAG: hypothetical protein J7L07_09710 [Candidatus Odinarchaeota archaeon]|nr:hypothetical protein [Candidatus Odinarchaeota archaeon]